jgi:hypothetical protein
VQGSCNGYHHTALVRQRQNGYYCNQPDKEESAQLRTSSTSADRVPGIHGFDNHERGHSTLLFSEVFPKQLMLCSTRSNKPTTHSLLDPSGVATPVGLLSTDSTLPQRHFQGPHSRNQQTPNEMLLAATA